VDARSDTATPASVTGASGATAILVAELINAVLLLVAWLLFAPH
jgi:hypothetical protein